MLYRRFSRLRHKRRDRTGFAFDRRQLFGKLVNDFRIRVGLACEGVFIEQFTELVQNGIHRQSGIHVQFVQQFDGFVDGILVGDLDDAMQVGFLFVREHRRVDFSVDLCAFVEGNPAHAKDVALDGPGQNEFRANHIARDFGGTVNNDPVVGKDRAVEIALDANGFVGFDVPFYETVFWNQYRRLVEILFFWFHGK